MPHIEESRHRGRSRSAPATFCTWEGVHPNVIGSLAIRLSQLGYGVLFGTTSDGGRLTLSVYMGELRRTCYFKPSVTPDEIFRAVAKSLGWDEPSAPPVPASRKPASKGTAPPAAIREETAPERADRLFEEKQDALQRKAIAIMTGGKKE